jgi:autotransporter-associated beta strand protein
LGDAVGAANRLSAFDITGTTISFNGPTVNTTGNQSYAGALTLGANTIWQANGNDAVILTSGSINSDSTARTLTLNATGANSSVVLNGDIGDVAALASFNANASAITLNGSTVNTNGNQTYAGPITVSQNTSLQSTGFNASIDFSNAINSNTASNRSLNVSASGSGSSVRLGGAIGNAARLGSLNISASRIALTSGVVNSSGNQSYTGIMTLGAGTTLTGANVTTTSGSTLAGAGNSLNITGNASLAGDVSNISTLNVSGTTKLAGNVTSTGSQTFAGAITLGANAKLAASGNSAVITANGSINSDNTARGLTLNATGTNGSVVLNGAVGNTAALANLTVNAKSLTLAGGTVNSTGNQSYAGAITLGAGATLAGANVTSTSGSTLAGAGNSLNLTGNVSLGGDVSNISTLNVSGPTKLAGNITSTGSQTFAGAITLGANAVLAASGNTAVISTNGSTNSDSTARALTLNATGTNGSVLVNGAVGNTAALANFTVNAKTITLAGGTVNSIGNQSYAGAISLGAGTTLSGSTVTTTAGSTVAGAANSLNISGNASLGGAVSNISSLNVSGTSKLAGNVTSTGSQTYAGNMTLGANAKLAASGNTAVITANGSINSDGTARALTLSATGTNGQVVLNQAIGSTSALESLSVTARSIKLNSPTVDTTGNQTYEGSISLGGNAKLASTGAASVIAANGVINSDGTARNLTVDASGSGSAILFNGELGNTAALAILNASASAIAINGGVLNTTGNQTLQGALILGRDLVLTSSGNNGFITLNGTLDSDANAARALTVAAGAGSTTLALNSSVGATQALSTFNNAAENTLVGNALNTATVTIKTTEDMVFDKQVQLLSPTLFNVSNTGSVAGVISGAGSLSKSGAGQLLLSSANTFTGNTQVNQGTLAISDAKALGSSSASATVANGAVLELQGVSVEGKPLYLQGGTVLASNGFNSWTGSVNLSADSQFDIEGQQLSVLGLINSGQSGLLVTGSGGVALTNKANALSKIATANTTSAVDVQNSVAMTVGEVTVGNLTAQGVKSQGAIAITSTASVTIAQGASVASAGSDVILETAQFVNQAGSNAIQASSGKKMAGVEHQRIAVCRGYPRQRQYPEQRLCSIQGEQKHGSKRAHGQWTIVQLRTYSGGQFARQGCQNI